jgi:kynurenine formamidase
LDITITHHNRTYTVDLNRFTDISIPIGGQEGVIAWYLGNPEITPVRDGDFVGEVAQGSSVNFRNILFNPHAHGTHTECMGHISREIYSVNRNMREFYFVAELITISPNSVDDDQVIEKQQLQNALGDQRPKALIIRTLPNASNKLHVNYSHTNPAYLDVEGVEWLREIGVEHLLIDLPSVDREVDGGALKSHKAFWNFPKENRLHCTITEFVYIPNELNDGTYFMNLQVAPMENDASPSRPLLHEMNLMN